MDRCRSGAALLLVGLGCAGLIIAGCVPPPPPPPECVTNADCDDGLFCNGEETCVAGACQAGTDPCEAGEDCDEAADECVPPAPECESDEDCAEDEFCDVGTGECVENVNLYAVTRVDADYAERVHYIGVSGHTDCTVCHHAEDGDMPDASNTSCRTCHPDDPNAVSSFKDIAHDENESTDGCRLCHAGQFDAGNCNFCHPDAPQ